MPIFSTTEPTKMEVLHTGHQREELDIELEGKKLHRGDSFVYQGEQCAEKGRRREEYVEEYRPERTR